MLNKKVHIKVVKVKLLKDIKDFSVWQLLIFALVFAAIGGYVIYRSFALCPTGGGPCIVGPSPPTGLAVDSSASDEVDLSWTASTSPISGYKIYRNNTLVGTVDSSAYYTSDEALADDGSLDPTGVYDNTDQFGGDYNDVGLSPATSYTYYAVAYDSYGNTSSSSNTITVKTQGTTPTAPTLTASVVSSSEIDLSWKASDSVNGINHYNIYRNNSLLATIDETASDWTGYDDSGLSAGTIYSYYVVAVDTLGSVGGHSNTISPKTSPAFPTPPPNLSAQSVSASEIDLSWQASSTIYPIASYRVYENTSPVPDPEDNNVGASPEYVGTTTSNSYKVTGLTSNTNYSFYVVAVDTAGNISGQSNYASDDTAFDTTTCSSTSTAINSLVTCPAYALNTSSRTRPQCAPSNTAWPYCSPLGDKSCQKVVGGPIYSNCLCKISISTCKGSCLLNTVNSTDGCRPSTTVPASSSCSSTGAAQTTWSNNGIDQGVDFSVENLGCKYTNPNSGDTGKYSADTRIYAMGYGQIKCVVANSAKQLPCPDNTSSHFSKRPKNAGTWLVYQLIGGPAGGLDIYVSENCLLPSNAIQHALSATNGQVGKTLGRGWQAGDYVYADSVLCEIGPKFTGIEMGWANNGTLARLASSDMWTRLRVGVSGYGNRLKTAPRGPVYVATPWGHSFNEFIEKSGCPGGNPIAELHIGSNNISIKGKKTLINGHGWAHHTYFGLSNYTMPSKYKKTPSNGGWWVPSAT